MITWRCGKLPDYSTFVPKSLPDYLRDVYLGIVAKGNARLFIDVLRQDPDKEEIFLMGKVVVCRQCGLSLFDSGSGWTTANGVAMHGCD